MPLAFGGTSMRRRLFGPRDELEAGSPCGGGLCRCPIITSPTAQSAASAFVADAERPLRKASRCSLVWNHLRELGGNAAACFAEAIFGVAPPSAGSCCLFFGGMVTQGNALPRFEPKWLQCCSRCSLCLLQRLLLPHLSRFPNRGQPHFAWYVVTDLVLLACSVRFRLCRILQPSQAAGGLTQLYFLRLPHFEARRVSAAETQ